MIFVTQKLVDIHPMIDLENDAGKPIKKYRQTAIGI